MSAPEASDIVFAAYTLIVDAHQSGNDDGDIGVAEHLIPMLNEFLPDMTRNQQIRVGGMLGAAVGLGAGILVSYADAIDEDPLTMLAAIATDAASHG